MEVVEENQEADATKYGNLTNGQRDEDTEDQLYNDYVTEIHPDIG